MERRKLPLITLRTFYCSTTGSSREGNTVLLFPSQLDTGIVMWYNYRHSTVPWSLHEPRGEEKRDEEEDQFFLFSLSLIFSLSFILNAPSISLPQGQYVPVLYRYLCRWRCFVVAQPRYSRTKLKIAVLEQGTVGKREWEREGHRERAGFFPCSIPFYSAHLVFSISFGDFIPFFPTLFLFPFCDTGTISQSPP